MKRFWLAALLCLVPMVANAQPTMELIIDNGHSDRGQERLRSWRAIRDQQP